MAASGFSTNASSSNAPEIPGVASPRRRYPYPVSGRVGTTPKVTNAPLAAAARTLRDHLDPAVVQIESKTTQAAEFEGLGPREPAKTHTLDASPHPGNQSHILAHGCNLTGQCLSGHFLL